MIQLRIRTEFSFGQTFAPIGKVIDRLKAIGCTAAGIVDVRSTWGHVPWFEACTKAGIQPLLGVECVVSDGDTPTSMWFLARSTEGLAELYRAMSKAHTQRFLTKFDSLPRLYEIDVLGMSDHILKFAGDVTNGAFLHSARAIIDINPGSRILNQKKLDLAGRYSLPIVNTSDNYYAAPEDRPAFELIAKSGLKPSPQYIMPQLDRQDVAQIVADQCKGLQLPKAPMIHVEGDLEALCRQGIKDRQMHWTKEYEERMRYELDLIKQKDFDSYFLIVSDMVRYAKRHMLVGPSRGSSAGSLVCYLTHITEIDPIPPRLYFERFIDVTRKDLPDIDLDFPDTKRHIVFEYMAQKYGNQNVAHIGTVSKFKPKSALIHVCKAMGIPPTATAAVKVAMIERSSADQRASQCLEDTFNTTKPGQQFIASYPQAAIAMTIEGHASHTGVHAAGLLVCHDDINNYAVVDQHGIAHIEKQAAETLGLLKIDVLGLRTLGVLEDSGVPIDWYHLPFSDAKTYEVFNQQRLCGIFQFEGNAMRSISALVKFKSITEIDAVTALARPGPFAGGVTREYIDRMSGKPYQAIHPLVEEQMSETFGLPIYQEQTMAIVRYVGGFDWKDTSYIRKAMSKRMGVEYFGGFVDKFLVGAKERGLNEQEARAIWDKIQTMGSWQMNKAHTFSYAVISYWCAYLKAHHPLEFAAANLRNAKDEEHAVELLREMTKEGIEYVPFDIDRSQLNWSVQDGKLIGGFLALKGFGPSKAQKMIDARQNHTMTEAQRQAILKAPNIFNDLSPLYTRYRHLYDDPEVHGVAGKLTTIDKLTEGLPHGDEHVFIGEVVHKNARNANEDAEIKKRGGKIEVGQLEYLDLRLRDDTGVIGARIGRKEYLAIGVTLLENVPIGAHLLVRARFWNGIRYAFIQKWKRLDQQ